jgi:branched-chain amino acid transport system substrate-binding protein
MRALGILTLSTTLLAGCSFTTAGGLSECETSAECGENMVCSQNFCLPLPAGCGQIYPEEPPPPSDAVQIGAVLPISNSPTNPDLGKDESEVQGLNAIKLALEEINGSGGAAGRKLALNLCDTAFDAARTRAQTEWLVKEKKIVALLTAGSTQTQDAAAISLPAGVLTMSSSGTSPALTNYEDITKLGLLWRTAPSDAIQGRVIASLIRDDPRFNTAQKIGLLYLDDAYGRGLFEVITERLTGSGKGTLALSYKRKNEPEITAAVAQMDTFDPDLTIVVGFEDDASLIIRRGASSTNLRSGVGHRWFFSDSAKDAKMLEDTTVRAQVQGAFGTAPAQGAGSAFRAFRSRFQAKYAGVDPSNFAFTSHSYDSMYLFGLAVAYSQGTSNLVSGTKMAEGLTKMSSGTRFEFTSTNFTAAATELAANRSIDAEGASGSLQFDAAGEAPSPIELWQVEGTNFKTIETLSPP